MGTREGQVTSETIAAKVGTGTRTRSRMATRLSAGVGKRRDISIVRVAYGQPEVRSLREVKG